MVPTLKKGDVVFWTPASVTDVHLGDIVVYKSSMGDKYIVHRVIEIKYINGEKAFVTKGDANEYPDQYGPHAVEEYVTSKNLVGKVVMVGNLPVKLPYVGYIYLYSQGFLRNLAGFTSVPLGIGALVFASILIEKEEKLDKKLLLIICNLNKIPFLRFFFITFLVFLLITESTLLFSYNELSVSAGVGEKATGGDININLRQGENATKSFWIVPHTFSPMKIVIFKEGADNIELEKNIDYLNPGEMKSEHIIVCGSQNGTYRAKFYIFTSPFWPLVPNSMIYYLSSLNPFLAAAIINGFVAFIITVFVVAIVLVISSIADLIQRHREKKELEMFIRTTLLEIPMIKKKRRKIISDVELNFKLILFSLLSALISIPVAIFTQLFIGVLFSAVISAIFLYVTDHWLKAEFVFTSLYSSLLLILIYTFINIFIIGKMGLQILLYAIGISLIVYLVFLIPVLIISLLTGYALFKYVERRRPEIILESDF